MDNITTELPPVQRNKSYVNNQKPAQQTFIKLWIKSDNGKSQVLKFPLLQISHHLFRHLLPEAKNLKFLWHPLLLIQLFAISSGILPHCHSCHPLIWNKLKMKLYMYQLHHGSLLWFPHQFQTPQCLLQSCRQFLLHQSQLQLLRLSQLLHTRR